MSGFSVRLWQDRKQLEVSPDGAVLSEVMSGSVVMEVLLPGENWHGFFMNGKKSITRKRGATLPDGCSAVKRYLLRIPINRGEGARVTTNYPYNHLKLVEIVNEITGEVRIWEVSVVSQRNSHWLVGQLVYEVRCYQTDSGYLYFPRLGGWQQMREQLICLMPRLACPCRDVWQEPQIDLRGVARNVGRVAWYNWARQVGCVRIEGGRGARAHWSQLRVRPLGERQFLQVGQLVKFLGLKKPVVAPDRVTGFRQELYGITLANLPEQ